MTKQFYEEFEVGDQTRSRMARTISESDVYTQSGLAGSYNPLHTDREYMKQTEYGRRIVQNTLLLTIISGLGRRTEWNPRTIAAYGRDHTRFVQPVFIGDTVRLTMEVAEKRVRDEQGGIVTFHEELYNQDDELTVVGEYLLLIQRSD